MSFLYKNYENLRYGLSSAAHSLPNLGSDTFVLIACDAADYTDDRDADQDLADIPSGAKVKTGTLTGLTIVSHAIELDNLALTSVTGDQFEFFVMAKNTGTNSTSPLMAKLDDASSGLPCAPDGGTINVVFDGGRIWGG